jgi:hypothetical protein
MATLFRIHARYGLPGRPVHSVAHQPTRLLGRRRRRDRVHGRFESDKRHARCGLTSSGRAAEKDGRRTGLLLVVPAVMIKIRRLLEIRTYAQPESGEEDACIVPATSRSVGGRITPDDRAHATFHGTEGTKSLPSFRLRRRASDGLACLASCLSSPAMASRNGCAFG